MIFFIYHNILYNTVIYTILESQSKINKKRLKKMKRKLTRLAKSIKPINKSIEKIVTPISKGKLCSLEGIFYEKVIFNITKKCKLEKKDMFFNTQEEKELGGSGADNDIICNYNKEKDLPIEIKKKKTPDWMQCCLKFIDNKWSSTIYSKIPEKSRAIFNNLIEGINLYDGEIPPFIGNKITHGEWVKIKQTGKFKDFYKDIPNDTIKKIYKEKGCYYIQVSDKGLYHLGEDICNFGVPEFICEQEIRIRTKVHTRKDKKGFCHLSVMSACKPKDVNKLMDSPFSLDKIEKLPKNLKYISDTNNN
jgi:hypothetical protein